MNVDISVVILSWNDKEHLIGLLESLQGASRRTMEVIVVDNASTDGSPELVESRFPEVKVIRNKENVGFPRGNNMGVRASSGKYVFVLNSDIKVLGKCVDILVDYMEEHPDIGMLGPRVLNADGTHQSSCRRNPTLWNNFCSAVGLARIFRNSRLFSGEHMFYFKGDKTIDVDVLVGCFWLTRRTALDQFGLLDEGFFLYAEDVDWCKRCWKAGWRVVFLPTAEAIHYGGASTTKKDPVRFAVTQQRSILRYWRKHHGLGGRLGISFVILSSLLIRSSATILNLVRPAKRNEAKVRFSVISACIRALFSSPATQ
jgi:GT2 family glycosyltransferase